MNKEDNLIIRNANLLYNNNLAQSVLAAKDLPEEMDDKDKW